MIGNHYRRLIVGLLLLLVATSGHAATCSSIFPGSQAFAVDGNAKIDKKSTCNGGACNNPPGFTIPALPGVNPGGSFKDTSISDGVYEHTNWGLKDKASVVFSGTGTAVIYFTGNVDIKKGTQINTAGSPSNVMIVVSGNLKVDKDTEINALIFVDGDADIHDKVTLTGALSVKGNLKTHKDSTFDFDSSYVSNADGDQFCEAGTAPAPTPTGTCSDIFPGSQAFAVDGKFKIDKKSTCNGGACNDPPGFTVPTLPSINATDTFKHTSISDGIYEHTGWGLKDKASVVFSGTGTAVIYFSGKVDIKKDTEFNTAGSPSNVILIISGDLKVDKGAEINALIFVTGKADIKENVTITGALSTVKELKTKKDSQFDFDPSYVSNADGGEFCAAVAISLDHYEIIHDGAGLTCESESVTIRACTDAGCTALSTDELTLDLQADATTKISPTFTGSTSVSFDHTTPETLTLSLSNQTIAATEALACSDGTGSSCDIDFTDAGFRFLYGALESTTIDNQVAGDSFAGSLKVQAVKNVNGVCSGLFSGSVTVQLAQQSITPGNTSSLDFTVDGGAIAKNSSAGVSSYTNRSLTFGASSIATIPSPVYEDAGQIRLHALYASGGISLYGNSNAFWVRPDKLTVTAQSIGVDLDAAAATALPVHKSGVTFDLEVTARNTNNVATPNYSPGQIQLLLQRTGPTTAGIDGILTYASASTLTTALSPSFQNVSLTSFNSGVSSYSAAVYSEVGLVNFDIQDSDYGGTGLTVPGDAIDIGRFTPEHFTASISATGSFLSACSLGAQDFTYIGEDFGYLAAPVISIEPRSLSGAAVNNYIDSFMHLTTSELTIQSPTVDNINTLALTTNTIIGLLSEDGDGSLSYTLNVLDQYNYTKTTASEVAPFTSDLSVVLTGISETLDGVTDSGLPLAVTPAGSEIRYGRLTVENTFGPEIKPLPILLITEHLSASGQYVTNTDDYCSAFISLLTTTPDSSPSGSHTSIPVGSGTSDFSTSNPVIAGNSGSVFSAPGISNTGEIDLDFDLSGNVKLQYDWDGNGSLDTSVQRTATFGQYRGHDRIIYWREVTQN